MAQGAARGALLAAVAAAALVCLMAVGAGVARADAAQVTVVAPGGAERTLSLDALAGSEDVRERPYILRSAEGESSVTVTGFSLAAVLAAADADPFSFSYLEVQRPAGGSVQLSRHQALDPGAFAEGPPVVYPTAAGTGFLRPSTGPEDLNASDSFEAPQGITLVLRKGEPLKVRAKATPVRTGPGKPVSFTAVVEQSGAGEQLQYSWYFDDGARASGAEVSHRFAKRGSYDVVLGVTTPGDDAGASAVVTIQVGAPLEGPDRKGGGTNPDADAPDHGAATGTGAAGAPGAGSGTGAPPVSVPPEAAPAPPAEPEQDKAEQPKPPPAGDLVEGRLLSSSEPFEPKPSERQPAARTGNLSEDGGGSPGLPGTALGLLVTAGLLGCGALIELRGGLR